MFGGFRFFLKIVLGFRGYGLEIRVYRPNLAWGLLNSLRIGGNCQPLHFGAFRV